MIEVLDENLNKVKSVVMKKPRKTYFLLKNAFNGSTFCFYFYNYRARKLELETYDQGLNKLASVEIDNVSKADRAIIEQQLKTKSEGNENMTGGINLFAVPGQGFIRNTYIGMGKSYSLTMYDNNLKPVWTISGEKSKDYETLALSEVNGKYAMGTIIRRPGLFSTKFSAHLAAFDITTGRKVLDTPIETNEKEQLSLSMINYDAQKDEFLVVGEFYHLDDKPFVNKSLGLFIKKLSSQGQPLRSTFYRWDQEVQAMLPPAALQRVEDKYINYIHQIEQDAEGNMYLVAEQYKIVVSGAGVAMKLLGGNASAMKGKVANLLVYTLSPTAELTDIHFYEKGETNVFLRPGSGIYGAGLLGHMINGDGNFDYQFTQKNNSQTNFDIAYLDYDKKAKEVALVDVMIGPAQHFATDRIDVTSSRSEKVYVYPAKVGYNMVVEFDIKEKLLDMKLVKLNKSRLSAN